MPNRDIVASVLLDKVYQLIQTKFHKQNTLVLKLAKHLFSNVSNDDLLRRNESDLYGAVVSLWKHLNETSPGSASVRVFDPTITRHGWQSSHTIIEIVMPDSPFLVDSLKMGLSRLDITCHLMLHGPIQIQYQKDKVSDITQGEKGQLHSLFHIEIDKLQNQKEMKELQTELEDIIAETGLVVRDWQAMVNKLAKVTTQVENYKDNPVVDPQNQAEAIRFLRWVGKHNFTFIGYKEFVVEKQTQDMVIVPTPEPGLGLLSQAHRCHKVHLSQLSDVALAEAKKAQLLMLTKGNKPSRIHRPAYSDYIGIKIFDASGNVIGEHRFIGLYTSAVYNQSVANIPLIKEKVSRILSASGYLKQSYSYKTLHNILETYPRDELLQAKEEELLATGMGVVQMQDRDLTRLFVRKDPFGRFLSCMVYVTKERYNTQLRKKTQSILKEYFKSNQDVEFTTFFSESLLARTLYIVHVDDNNMDVDVKYLEHNIMEASSSWDDRLKEAIIATFGESKGLAIAKEYMYAFPRSYKEDTLPSLAITDIERLEALKENDSLGMLFYRSQEEEHDSQAVRLKLYSRNEPIHLSDVMPMLENFGLRVIGESPYKIARESNENSWLLDFSMLYKPSKPIVLESARERFQQAFAAVWAGELENDGFNQLVLAAGLSYREVMILRAYARYMRQIGFPFSQTYIEETLTQHASITQLLLAFFHARFDPESDQRSLSVDEIESKIVSALNQVDNLDDDRIISRYIEMIKATLRTNFYVERERQSPTWLSFKLCPASIPDMPKPIPEFEIFVYSADIEGVHLRGGKVARGGLRWSDRPEDFRTEVLGLVKAQQVKNSVIVPVGAKGGFVCKHQHKFTHRDDIFVEGKRCYQQFIRGLLDVTDNIVSGKVSSPVNVVCHDDDDPYLVVAADKGTATFSDLANTVAQEYQFWLGDAFASGGSYGYDHKAMGITARGAWESVKRHFRELSINCQTTDFTVIGIGDMAGDVFGNGMLLSKHIQLQAAFNHQHIFIDPQPDAKLSWQERERLFKLPRSSWEDYDPKRISKGGGVFLRNAKSITLTPEIQKMLATNQTKLTPNELIKRLLSMPVDLLWNGGIGTYVKSSSESHVDVGDRANDDVRINGRDLQAKVVGEGGNLGLTQLGRIEYALHGGRANTDFVDNVGGVDCSDNEVNIKILLNAVVNAGDLTQKQRNQILNEMEPEVASIVLEDAYCQAESISISQMVGVSAIKEQSHFVSQLEKQNKLDRALEYLPTDEEFAEREKSGQGLSRPEVSVLIAYAKMVLKEQLITLNISDDEYHGNLLTNYFPSKLRRHYKSAMTSHPLKAEIVATVLANQIVNEMGCHFISRLQEETVASIAEIVNAYSVARHVFGFESLIKEIRQLDNKVPTTTQYELLSNIRQWLRRLTKWLLRNHVTKLPVMEIVSCYQEDVDQIIYQIDQFLVPQEVEEQQIRSQVWQEVGVPPVISDFVARLPSLYSCFDIVNVVKETGYSIESAAKLYFALGDRLSLHWFLNQINQKAVNNHWQALARASFREDLDWQQRQLTIQVLKSQCNADIKDVSQVIECWIESHQEAVVRWQNTLDAFKVGAPHEFAKFSVAMRELMLLNLNCKPKH